MAAVKIGDVKYVGARKVCVWSEPVDGTCVVEYQATGANGKTTLHRMPVLASSLKDAAPPDDATNDNGTKDNGTKDNGTKDNGTKDNGA